MSRSALIAALGAVTFAFGLASLLLAMFQPLMPALLVYGNLALGLVLLAVGGITGFDSLRARVRSGGGRRAGVYGTSAVLGAALWLVFLALLAFLSTRYTQRFDWSEQAVNTLSGQTLVLLRELESTADAEGDVQLTAFFREQDSDRARDLLERYDGASERLQLRFVDPNQRPDLVEAHALAAADLARGLLLITRGEDAVSVTQFGEAEITNALQKLTPRAERQIYFLTGHNERAIGGGRAGAEGAAKPADEASSPDGAAGFARAAAALRNETWRVAPLDLATAADVPDDADVIVIAGPTQPFFDAEREALARYLTRGGALFLMLDPRAQTNLGEDLAAWGIEVGDDVVVDPVMSVERQPTAPVAERYGEGHPIGANLGRTVFSMVRSVRASPDASADLAALVFTSENAWAERGIDEWMKTGRAMQDPDDLAGPLPIAVAGRPRLAPAGSGADPRIVVVGDSNFATNELLDVFSNRALFLDSIGWLLGDEERIAVRPNVSRSSSVSLTAGELQVIQYLSLFVLPEGIALVGVFVWWARRRNPAG